MLNTQEITEGLVYITRQRSYEDEKARLLRIYLEETRKLVGNTKGLIAVHLTDFFPERGIIKPTSAGTTKVEYNGKAYEIHYPRETIHFTLNGPVEAAGGGLYGTWEQKKYAILIPLEDMIQRVVNFAPMDTFIFGELKLPKSAEIIGKEKDAKWKADSAGNARIITIKDGDDIKEAVKNRIREKGYAVSITHDYGWSRVTAEEWKKSEDAAKLMMSAMKWTEAFGEMSKKIGKDMKLHADTEFSELESDVEKVFKFLSAYNKEKYDDIQNISDLAERLVGHLRGLRAVIKNSNIEEEIKAYRRIFNFVLNLVKDLREKYNELKKEEYKANKAKIENFLHLLSNMLAFAEQNPDGKSLIDNFQNKIDDTFFYKEYPIDVKEVMVVYGSFGSLYYTLKGEDLIKRIKKDIKYMMKVLEKYK